MALPLLAFGMALISSVLAGGPLSNEPHFSMANDSSVFLEPLYNDPHAIIAVVNATDPGGGPITYAISQVTYLPATGNLGNISNCISSMAFPCDKFYMNHTGYGQIFASQSYFKKPLPQHGDKYKLLIIATNQYNATASLTLYFRVPPSCISLFATNVTTLTSKCASGVSTWRGSSNAAVETNNIIVQFSVRFVSHWNTSFPDTVTFNLTVGHTSVVIPVVFSSPPWNGEQHKVTIPQPIFTDQLKTTRNVTLSAQSSYGQQITIIPSELLIYLINMTDFCNNTTCVDAVHSFNETLYSKSLGRCFKELDDKLFGYRYGRCKDNLPPVIRAVSGDGYNLIQPFSADEVIGRIRATDPEGGQLIYQITRFGSVGIIGDYYDCATTKREICLSKFTGEIKTTFSGANRSLTNPIPAGTRMVMVVTVSDRGRPPYRESSVEFTITWKDQCSPVSDYIHELTKANCMKLGIEIRGAILIPGSFVSFSHNTCDVMFEVTLRNLQLPLNVDQFNVSAVDSTGHAPWATFPADTYNATTKIGKFKVNFQFRSFQSIKLMIRPIVGMKQLEPLNVLASQATALCYDAKTYCSNLTCMDTIKSLKKEYNSMYGSKRDKCFNQLNVLSTMSCLDYTHLLQSPKNLTASLTSRSEENRVLLQCKFLSRMKPKVTWLKNGKPIDTTKMVPWQQDPIEVVTLTWARLSFAARAGDEQGYYQCNIEEFYSRSKSDVGIVVFGDVSTSDVTLHITNKIFTESLANSSSHERRILESQINDEIGIPIRQILRLPPQAQSAFSIHNIWPGSVIVNGRLYLSNVDTSEILLAACEKLGDIKPTTENLTIDWSRSNLVSLGCCNAITEDDGKGEFAWTTTAVRSERKVPCLENPLMFATKRCDVGHRSDLKPIWLKTNDSACKFASKTTKKLSELAEVNVTPWNVVNVTKDLYNLTKDPSAITNHIEVTLITRIVENIEAAGTESQQTFEELMTVLSSVAATDEFLLAKAQKRHHSPSRLLRSMQSIANSHPFPEFLNGSISVVRPNASFAVIFIESQPISGLSISNHNGSYNMSRLNHSSILASESSIYLPASALMKGANDRNIADVTLPLRVTSFSYPTGSLFLDVAKVESNVKPSSKRFLSRVLSASLGNIKLRNLSEPIRGVFMTPSSEKSPSKTRCVFWDFKMAGWKGGWSSKGCILHTTVNSWSVCHCNHLTNFAVILDVNNPKNTVKNLALDIVTFVGIGISIACLLLTLLSYALFKSVRRSLPPRILMSLCVALLGIYMTFAIGIDRTSPVIGCRIVAMLIHYFVLATFLWMAAEGVNLYYCFVKVVGYRPPRFMLKASIVCWGLPFVVVMISAVSKFSNYGSANNCMVHSATFFVALLSPVIFVILANFVVLGLVMRGFRRGSLVSKDKKFNLLIQARIATGCTMLLGLSWIFGVLAVGDLRMFFQWLFCICNCLQGLYIFLFYCVRNKDIVNEWKLLIGPKESYDVRSGTHSSQTDQKAGKDESRNNQVLLKRVDEGHLASL